MHELGTRVLGSLLPAFVTVLSYSPLSFEDAMAWGGGEGVCYPSGSRRDMPNNWIDSAFHDLSVQGLSQAMAFTASSPGLSFYGHWRFLLGLVLTKVHYRLTSGYGNIYNTVDIQAALSNTLCIHLLGGRKENVLFLSCR